MSQLTHTKQVQSRCIPSNLTGVFSYRNLWSRSMRLPGCWSACPWLLCSFFCFALAEFYFPFSPGDCSLSQRRIGRINQHIASDWDCFVSTVINTLLPRNKKLVQLLQKFIKKETDWEQGRNVTELDLLQQKKKKTVLSEVICYRESNFR